MSSFTDTLQTMANLSYKQLCDVAELAINRIQLGQGNTGRKRKNYSAIAPVMISAAVADGDISEQEKKFIMDVLNIDEDNLNLFIIKYKEKETIQAKEFVKNIGEKYKTDVYILVSSVLACDKTINEDEISFLTDLIS